MSQRQEELLGLILAELQAINRRAERAEQEAGQRQAEHDKLTQSVLGALPPEMRQIFTGGHHGN